MELLIGDKAWSSWSLRPWLALKRVGAPFTETLIPLRRPDTAERARAAGSPNGKVPVLKDGGLVVWDSLAICEHLAERFPQAELWPEKPRRRALARSAGAEMHSGFPALRTEMPMDVHLRTRQPASPAVAEELRRLLDLWRSLRVEADAAAGPWLLGNWSIADAMFAPVCTRLRSYGVDLAEHGDGGAAQAYVETTLSDPAFKEWEAAA